jgi:hypothetical protein
MKTEELVAVLMRDDPRPAGLAPTSAIMFAAILALTSVLLLSITWLQFRTDLTLAVEPDNRVFVLKLLFTLGIVASALPIVRDLSVPGRKIRWISVLAAVPFAVVIILALRELSAHPMSEWNHHVGHVSWLECLWKIPALSIPAFVILAAAVRRLAPTKLMHAGACVGLLAGGFGAVGYALHCHDDVVAFVALEYSVAILEVVAVGALLGPRVLRWA